MTVKIRQSRNGKGWQYDIHFKWPDGTKFRERKDAPVSSKSGALRYAQARETSLLMAGKDAHVTKVMDDAVANAITLANFWPDFVRDHYKANRKKASTIEAAESIYKLYLANPLGAKPLADIKDADVAALKGALASKSPKTVNNMLAVLGRLLRCAVEWGKIPAMPCRLGMLRVDTPAMSWYERDEFARLVATAKNTGTAQHVLVLLAGSAGLRLGEIIALKWSDLDLVRKLVHVRRAVWKGVEDVPKGNRTRIIPMTDPLLAALKAHRHLRGDRVLYDADGNELTNHAIRYWLASAERVAGLVSSKEPRRKNPYGGGIHKLRHSFCSHLALAGVPAKAIQELAGHLDLKTTLRYMHLSPGNRSSAIATLSIWQTGADELHGTGAERDFAVS